MSDEAPLLKSKYGLQLPGTEIFLDPKEPVACAVISHAHGDHAIPGHDTVYCTYNTAKLLRARFRFFAHKVITPAWNETFTLEGIPFRFTSAGHMLGSAKIVWERNNKTIVYTGDFKRQADTSCEPYEVTPCDILVTESTFGQPGKHHPDDESAIRELQKFPGKNFVIGTYSLGKSQRVISIINRYLPELKIMVHPKIAIYNKIYKEAGFDIGNWSPYQRQVFRKQTGIVYLIPPSVLQSYLASPYCLRGMASGWDHLQQGMEVNLLISDHADWQDLINTIQECGAKTVYTVHGDGKLLSDHLTPTGIQISEL